MVVPVPNHVSQLPGFPADSRATGWAVPGTEGGVVMPWVVFVIGEDGPMAMLPPADVRDLGGGASGACAPPTTASTASSAGLRRMRRTGAMSRSR